MRRTFAQNGYIVERLRGIRSIVKEGVTGLPRGQNLVIRSATLLVIVLSLGFFWDIQYPQIAFRIRQAPRNLI